MIQSLSPFTWASILAVAAILITHLIRAYRRYAFFQNLPGSKDYSLIYGNLHVLPKTPEGRLRHGVAQMHKSNRFYRLWFGSVTPVIYTCHPETVKTILQSSAPKSRGFGSIFSFLESWIGGGLVVANGKRWARSRRLLTPAFHYDVLKQYIDVYNKSAESMFVTLDKKSDSGQSFDLYPLVTLYTLEVILKCAFGYQEDVQNINHPYARIIQEILDIISNRFLKPWLWPDCIFRLSPSGKKYYRHLHYIHNFAEEAVLRRKEALERDGVPKSRTMDFIDILLTAKDDDGNPMSDVEIRNEVDTFMFAGHDTTASSISWCLYTLAKYPEYQQKIRSEIDSILDGREKDDITWSDLSQLNTLALCLKESMRLFPPVPFIQRQLDQDVDLAGHTIPSGTMVTVALHHLHRNPDVWEDPEEYKPERFLVENRARMDPFAFLPFSAGARNCIGQQFALNEEKVLISRILRRYHVGLAPDRALPAKNATLVLRAENGIWLTLTRRKDKEKS